MFSTAEPAPLAPVKSRKRTQDESDVPTGAPLDREGLTREVDKLSVKLNDTARDIVEGLESQLPADLERRYKKGERDVYLMHLFARRGKKLLRAVQSRYESDRALRTRVDSYVRLFERLLDTVSEVPRGEEIMEGIIESETGQVYMTLAEASGRISP